MKKQIAKGMSKLVFIILFILFGYVAVEFGLEHAWGKCALAGFFAYVFHRCAFDK